MPFLLMVFLTLACLPELDIWPEPLIPAPFHLDPVTWSALLTGVTICLPLFQAFYVSRRVARPLKRDHLKRDQSLRRYDRGRFLHQIVLFGSFSLVMCIGGWGWSVKEFWRAEGFGTLPGAELVVLLPFLVAMLLSWVIFYDAENALHKSAERIVEGDPLDAAFENPYEFAERRKNRSPDRHFFGGRWSFVLFQARQKLALLCVPIFLLLGQKELQRHIDVGTMSSEWVLLLQAASFGMIAVVFLTMPLAVRVVLGLKPLPAGSLRTLLENASRRLGFRASNILVWNTRRGMANAMVVGILPWPRYVVFTDKLLNDFAPDEVEAVFGHEVGHVKHHHMLYYFVFLSVSMTVLGMLAHWCLAAISLDFQPALSIDLQHLEVLPMIAFVLLYILFVFGFISRRCERQADIYGCRAVSCGHPYCVEHDAGAELASAGSKLCPTGIRTFIRALEKVADLNGISRDRPGFLQSWQHSTIARRVAFLQTMIGDPAIEPAFQRRVALVKWGLFAVLGALLVAVLITGSYTYANF